jgi:hypothetical protein
MKHSSNKIRFYFTLVVVLSFNSLMAQQVDEAAYLKSIDRADSLLKLKEYLSAATLYNATFILKNRGKVKDRYNAAISWTLAGNPDSAFYQLYRIATLGQFAGEEMLTSNKSFVILHTDKRWEPLIKRVQENKKASGENALGAENIGEIKQKNL